MKKKRLLLRRGKIKFPLRWVCGLLSLITLALLLPIMQTQAQEQARFDLRMQQADLRQVIEKVRELSHLSFTYQFDDIKPYTGINIDVKQKTVAEILDECLKNTKLAWRQVDKTVIIYKRVANAPARAVTVKGFVYDTGKQPLPGVTVRVVEMSVGTATNEKGWFSIDLPLKKGTLEFSFVGFKKQRVEFSEKTDTLRIVLEEDVSGLDEVVVRAYSTQNKREVVSSISMVTAEEMKELPAASIVSMLQGRLAGVNIVNQSGAPGSAANVTIRGFNSLLQSELTGASDGQPLYVVDGIPIFSFTSSVTGTNTLADIDPTIIESVSVLKDAAAASIYGSRASNGVIMITTKKGRAGEAKFSVNASYSLSQLTEWPEQTGGRMERWVNILHNRGMRMGSYNYERNIQIFPTSYETAYGTTGTYDGFWGNGAAGGTSTPSLQDSLSDFYNNSTNWWKYVFRTARVLNATLSASGGNEKFQYMLGAGLYDETGIMINSDYKRYNVITNLTASPNLRLKANARLYLAYMNKSTSAGGEMNGKYEGITANPENVSTLLPGKGEINDKWLEAMKTVKVRGDDYRVMGNLGVELALIDGLTLSASGNVDFSQANLNYFRPSTLDIYYHENVSRGKVERHLAYSTEELLRYRKTFNEAHTVEVLLGFNVNKQQMNFIGGEGHRGASDYVYYFSSKNAPSSGTHDYGPEGYPDVRSLMIYDSDFQEIAMTSFFSRFSYNWKQRYLIEFAFRRDGSSTFGEANRWANFPSIALGWTFSEEPFIKNFTGNWLNWGKLRASWGKSGKIFDKPYLAHGLMAPNNYVVMGNTGMSASENVAPDLTWEKSDQYDVGIDLDMFNYALKVKLDYYYKNTTSLLYRVILPGDYFGCNTQIMNAMGIVNSGLELELEGGLVQHGPVMWRTKFNAARNWNRVKKTYNDKDLGELVIGRPLYQIYVYDDMGYWQNDDEVPVYFRSNGEPVYFGGDISIEGTSGLIGAQRFRDLNGDNLITNADIYPAASPVTLVSGGWTNELTWRNFDLSVLFVYGLGRHIVNLRRGNILEEVKMVDVRKYSFWEKEGDNTDLPRRGATITPYTRSNIEKVHQLSLKQLTLGYNFSTALAKKLYFSGIRAFFTVENMFYLSNYSGENPEIVNVYTGIDVGNAYPLPRKWTFGLTLNF